jgi:hypothetical protein
MTDTFDAIIIGGRTAGVSATFHLRASNEAP